MEIKVIKKDERYFAQFHNFDSSLIKKSIVRKTWDKSYILEVVPEEYKIYSKRLELFDRKYNLLEINLPLDESLTITEFYILKLIDIYDVEYEYYIDYNTFHGILSEDELYKFTINENVIDTKKLYRYSFYIVGNNYDKHLINLVNTINSKELVFRIPNKKLLKSSDYLLEVYLQNKKIDQSEVRIITDKNIDFVFDIEDYENYFKYSVTPKRRYKRLNQFNLDYNGKKINVNEKKLSNVMFYLPKHSLKENRKIVLKYRLYEDTINGKYYDETKVYDLTPYKKKYDIDNFDYHYDYSNDIMVLRWTNKSSANIKYKININNNMFYTDIPRLVIHNYSHFNNNQTTIPCIIEYDSNNKYSIKNEYELPNYIKLESPNNFIPKIDYSDCLKNGEAFGKLQWTTPAFPFYSVITINVKHIDQFLDEYLFPWETRRILNEPVENFDLKYTDYNKLYDYDFPVNGEKVQKTPNDTLISYDGTKQGRIYLGEVGTYQLPLWFCENDSEYTIKVEIYDSWGQLCGSNTINFKLDNIKNGEITEDNLIFKRNQEIQFGESGTVGEYYKVINPKPIDVMKHYSTTYKSFTGKPLYNIQNTDSDNNSLYYYLNTKEGEKINFSYSRSYNFYRLEYKILDPDNNIILEDFHIPLSNDYSKNKIDISKEIFLKEGIYTMQIKTFNSSMQSSKIKDINFFIFNERPEQPNIKINNEDFNTNENGYITINKKFFHMEVTNNKPSKKYAGWQYKEAHFFFKKKDGYYNQYADYVVLADKDNGSIVLNNTVEIENGSYMCKVVCYDYNGNKSDSSEIEFDLISTIKIIPEKLFTNDLVTPFKWLITKSQECEGFYYFFRYSKDGINYEDSIKVKVVSPYYIDDPNTKKEYVLETHWLTSDSSTVDEGLYKLVVFEYNKKHPEGLEEYEFESPVVDVNVVANPSQPIYAKKSDTAKVFNEKQFNEYVYTSSIETLVFETINSEPVLDNPETSVIEGQRFKIQLIDPSGNKFFGNLPIPTETGIYQFTNITNICNITNPQEGVWELRFITTDKYGNDNSHRGYYTYKIVYVNRDPKISSLTTINSTGSNIFGLNSTKVGYYVSTSEIYENIANYDKYKDLFQVNKFELNMIYTPSGSSYKTHIYSDDKGIIEVINPLTESDKLNHYRDGKYLLELACIDPLNRKSSYENRNFYIDTKLNGEINFINNNIFNSHIVDLIATASGEVKTVYYTFDKNKDDVKTWDKVSVREFLYNENTIYGIELKNMNFDNDGSKILYYVLEEESGNMSNIKAYYFSIDTSIKLIPIFNYDNKVYYTKFDDSINIGWDLTNEDVNHFYFKLDKIEQQPDGSIEVVESYMPSTSYIDTLIPVGPGNNDFVDIKEMRNINISLIENGYIIDGYYMVTIKGFNIYGGFKENSFRFQIDTTTQLDIGYEIINNKITIDSNIITWNHILKASSYEVSYDGITWIKTVENKFMVDTDRISTDKNGNNFIYMRWKTYGGVYSSISKINLKLNIIKLKTPSIYFYNNKTISESNKKIEWIVEIPDADKAKYLYYSFDNKQWFAKPITSSKQSVLDTTLEYPIKDGRYDIFVKTTDENPLIEKFFNKSELVHATVDVFAQDIEKPIFSGLKSGMNLSIPVRLFIENKDIRVQYFIFVNNILVPEGYEISSSSMKKFNIEVKGKKKGLEKIYDLIPREENYHVFSLTTEPYEISIGNSKVICIIDDANSEIEVQSMPNKRNSEIIRYRKKNSNEKWNVLRVGDRLSIDNEWEFHISTFAVI